MPGIILKQIETATIMREKSTRNLPSLRIDTERIANKPLLHSKQALIATQTMLVCNPNKHCLKNEESEKEKLLPTSHLGEAAICNANHSRRASPRCARSKGKSNVFRYSLTFSVKVGSKKWLCQIAFCLHYLCERRGFLEGRISAICAYYDCLAKRNLSFLH